MSENQSDVLLKVGTNELEIIEFYINEHGAGDQGEPVHFGVNVAKVLEVIELPDHKRPSAPPHPSYLGTIPLRDRILPIIDLAVCLDMVREPSPYEVVLVTQFNQRTTGFLVSGVTRIFRLPWTEVQPPSRYLTSMDCNCVTGTVTLDGHFALLLDLERLIVDLDPDLGADAEVDAGPDADRDAGGPLRALVSEDSTTMRSLVRQKLQEARFATEAFQNGQEAWNRLKDMRDDVAARGRPITDLLDVVISDIEMPAMDGYTLTRHIKEDPVLKVLPVILFSSLITDELRHKGESVGADDQISKPEFGTLAQRAMALIRAARATA